MEIMYLECSMSLRNIFNFRIRGRLASSMMAFRNIGLLISFILGATIDYYTIPLIFIIFPIVFLIIFLTMPNTPQYHIQRGDTQVNYLSLNRLFNIQISDINM